MSLTDVAVELYALPPAEFTAARNARVRQLRADGDRELARRVAALRRPTLAAWAVDLLVRHRPQEVEALLALGAGLLEAQVARAGERLRALDREQHTRMAALRAEARRLAADAGQQLTGAVDVPLESTLRAAMTDADAAAAVRSGLLVTDLQSTGFGPVEVGDAVAVPGAPALTGGRPAVAGAAGGADAAGGDAGFPGAEVAPPRRAAARRAAAERDRAERDRAERDRAERAAERRRERDRAAHDLAEAEARSAAADDAADRAEGEVTRAAEAAATAGAEVERLVGALAQARARQASAALDEQRAATVRDAAVDAAGTARRRARAARDRRDALT